MSDFMREEFEVAFVARCKKKGLAARLDRFDDGRYEYLEASDAWWAWQASRECLVIELPKPIEVEVVGVGCTCHSEYLDVEQVEKRIESYGVKIK